MNSVWLVGAPVFDEDKYGAMVWKEGTLHIPGLYAFSSEGAALTHAAVEGRAELRALLTEDILSDYVSDIYIGSLCDSERHRLNQLLHGEIARGDSLIGPFRELTNVECDEVLEILPLLKWIVRALNIEK